MLSVPAGSQGAEYWGGFIQGLRALLGGGQPRAISRVELSRRPETILEVEAGLYDIGDFAQKRIRSLYVFIDSSSLREWRGGWCSYLLRRQGT